MFVISGELSNKEKFLMKFNAKRSFLVNTFAASMLAMGISNCMAANSQTSAYPESPVKVLVPWADGFPANSARLFSEELSKRLGQPVVVDVRAGAGGEVAARQLIGAPSDGYTLLATGSSITIRSVLDEKNVDGLRDLQPIGQVTTTPYVIVARKGRFGSFDNLLKEAKANPGKFNYASAGVGTGMHYLGELINDKAAIEIVHVPYATGSRQLLAVNAGDVELAVISLVTALPHIKSGALEALAVSTTARSQALPNVPTLVEKGLKDIPNLGAWIAFFGPKNIPQDVLKRLSNQIQAISKDPNVQATVASWGADLPDSSIASLDRTIKAEKASWKTVIKK